MGSRPDLFEMPALIATHMDCTPDTVATRIEFAYEILRIFTSLSRATRLFRPGRVPGFFLSLKVGRSAKRRGYVCFSS